MEQDDAHWVRDPGYPYSLPPHLQHWWISCPHLNSQVPLFRKQREHEWE